ncbi:glycoside hydrolase family 5 protein [Cutibacterium sp. WCA-380-WT-3A]|uniref:Glycoside hydrolase family 5 protein n=1 Tax=Cutibacterium porci TaxID=2605781 RepID=A0A7K0J9L0_9ACTN|nr:cellulase family glycosylhydrolase [Cutibacterium porci]MSS46659.1 glycoside hydrolase family 5 protein [Cutibacterium porci]
MLGLHASAHAATQDNRSHVAVSSAITDSGPIDQKKRWYTDGQGRVLLTAGVNLVSKNPPYSPEAAGFDEADAAWLQNNGFDSVRLGIIWKAVEPSPGVYNDNYLASITRTIRLLRSHGIMTLLDAHQDMYNEKFQGEGAPDWAVLDKGMPNLLKVGFPSNQLFNLGLIKAYDSFLTNATGPGGVGLQDRYASMWKHVAHTIGNEPGVMGYDIMNEPWPGHHYPICYLALGWCGSAMKSLNGMYQKVGSAIVAADPDAIVTYEPYSTWNQGLNSRPRRPSVPRAAMSWHVYCSMNALFGTYLGCNLPDNHTFRNADRAAIINDSASLLSEFGATKDVKTLMGVTLKARTHLVGWQYWTYNGCNDPTTQNVADQDLVSDIDHPGPVTDGQVDHNKLGVLAVPHLRATAGTPTSTSWAPSTNTYQASWSSARVAGDGNFVKGSISEIAVPSAHYPHGYEVKANGGEVVSAPGALRLQIRSTGEGSVSVTITPASEKSGSSHA